MKNPCRECPNMGRYDSQRCRNCEDRQAYVAAIGGMAASMPMELTDAGGRLEREKGAIPMSEKIETKACERCGQERPVEAFRKTRNGGRAGVCEECRAKAQSDSWKKKRALEERGTAGGLGVRMDAPAKGLDSYEGLALPPGHEPDPLLAQLFTDNELTLQRLHWLAHFQRRSPRDQIMAMVEQATPEWDPNDHNQKMREVIYGC